MAAAGPVNRLDALTWTDVAARASSSVLVVPVGSTEQHGPHLPLGTDALVAAALAERLAAARPHVLLGPALPYGASGEHAGFPGTVSIGTDALAHVLVELGRSCDDLGGLVLVNGHGGNAEALARASGTLRAEGRRVLAWSPRHDGDAHAGHAETSLLLALTPDLVRTERAEAGDRRPVRELLGALRAGGVAAVSPNGVLGDPAGASAEAGWDQLGRMEADLLDAVDRWWAQR